MKRDISTQVQQKFESRLIVGGVVVVVIIIITRKLPVEAALTPVTTQSQPLCAV